MRKNVQVINTANNSSEYIEVDSSNHLDENGIIDVFEGIESDFKESDESNDENEQLLSTDEENVKFIPITGIMNNISSSETMYYLPRHRRCACHTLNLIAKNDIYKEMDIGVTKLIQSTEV